MSFRFENLDVWKEAREFVKEIYKVSADFPKEELYCLTDQLRRAVISIVLNIAEGSDRKSDIDFRRFLRTSIGSLEEVVACLYLALDLRYIDKEKFDKIYEQSNKLAAMINAFIKAISSSSKR
ncbi:MAG: four helix bundle protein [Patescibacteria group bacterium]|nr:four helix bundle protein [Patescibacteria group bacterium]